jgi:mRNA-degrading endonuclease toxin of MazEF toxin-antitoxin module
LIDHLRSIDKRRIRTMFGVLPPQELASIDAGLRLYLGLDVK